MYSEHPDVQSRPRERPSSSSSGRAIAQAVIRRFLFEGSLVQSRVNSSDIGGRIGNRPYFSLRIFGFPCSHHSTIAPYPSHCATSLTSQHKIIPSVCELRSAALTDIRLTTVKDNLPQAFKWSDIENMP
jgi:hypothetical protein